MTFKKRQDITLTQMAQWVDANMSAITYDEATMVEYLYHLVFTRAQQCSLCRDYATCDDFSIYCVTKLLTRINNKSKEPLKSVVNYIRTVIELWWLEYIRLFCQGNPDLDVADFDLCDFGDYLIDSTSQSDYNSYACFCFRVSDVVRKHLKKIPRKKNDSEWSNICTSCMLTLHDRIKSAIDLSQKNTSKEHPCLLSRIIRSLKTKPPILFHIDESMSGYINVLVTELIHAISVELSDSLPVKVLPSSCLKNLIIAANNQEED